MNLGSGQNVNSSIRIQNIQNNKKEGRKTLDLIEATL